MFEILLELKSAQQSKGEFLSMVNHEMMTPLNAVIIGSEILIDNVESKDKEICSAIYNSGNLLRKKVALKEHELWGLYQPIKKV